MVSRLLSNLERAVRDATDAVAWAKLVCRVASHYARQGQVTQAKEAIETVRTAFQNRFDPEVAARLMLAEGILEFFAGNSPAAFDRIRRAHGIAVSMDAKGARPSCSAWMAHLLFNDNRYSEMISCLKDCLDSAPKDDHPALARSSLVIADAFHFAGSFDRARPWYESARLHATAEGDDATLSALLHNIAAFRAGNLRLAAVAENSSKSDALQARLEAESARNFDAAIGTKSFLALIPLLQAQVLSMEGKFTAAIPLLRSISPESLPDRLVPQHSAELAYCLSKEGNLSSAKSYIDAARKGIARIRDADDRAYVHLRLAAVENALGMTDLAGEHIDISRDEMLRYKKEQAELLAMMAAAFGEAGQP